MDIGEEDMIGSDPIGDPESVLNNLTTVVNMTNANASLNLRCGVLDDNYMKVWNACQWWCEGIFFTGIGLVGLVANFASIGILSTKDMRKHSFNQLLIALAIFDILFIMVSIPVYAFSLFELSFVGNQIFSRLYVYFLYPMSPVTLCASIYMTLAITVERYLAVCKPIMYRNLTLTMSSTKRVLMYVTPVVFVSFCLNIPKFLETQANDKGDNSTEIKASDTRLNPTYMLYYTISQIFHPTLTTGIFPMAALIYMNASIFSGIRKNNAMRNQRLVTAREPAPTGVVSANNNNTGNNAAQASSSASQQQNRQSENNLAIVLIGIVIMHLACHSLRVFLAILSVHLIGDTIFCMQNYGGFTPPLWTMCAESVSSLMIMINFSGNFLIYCSVLTPFKAVLANSCDSPWCNRLRRIFQKPGNVSIEEVEVADEHHLQQQTEIMAISGSSTHQQSAVVVNRENSVCGELPKSARVLRMVNRRRKKAETKEQRTSGSGDDQVETESRNLIENGDKSSTNLVDNNGTSTNLIENQESQTNLVEKDYDMFNSERTSKDTDDQKKTLSETKVSHEDQSEENTDDNNSDDQKTCDHNTVISNPMVVNEVKYNETDNLVIVASDQKQYFV